MSEPAATAPDEAQPWPGLDSFTEASRRFFFGRQNEEEELFRRIRRETATLLFGQSGRGKTSLLQAGLFPRLRESGFLPVLVRLDYGPTAAPLFDQVKALLRAAFDVAGVRAPTFEPDEGLWEYLHRTGLTIVSADGDEITPVLVFDQFETVFTLGLRGADIRTKCRDFLIELADLIENRPSAALKARLETEPDLTERYIFNRDDYRVVIALREDYLPHLESLRARAPSLGPNRFRLTRMDGGQAMAAVVGPGRSLVTDEVAQAIVKVVSSTRLEDPFVLLEGEAVDPILGLEVEPALLSLFCRGLNSGRIEAGLLTITAELLAQKREQVIESFYEEAFAGHPVALREFVEDELVTETGFRDSMTRTRAERELASRGVAASALDDLVHGRLLRIEERLEESRVELIHDLLTDVVQKSRRRRRQAEEEARVLAANQEAERREAEIRHAYARRRRKFGVFAGVGASVLVAIIVALSGMVLHAQKVQSDLRRQWADCSGSDPAKSIAGCTAFIKTGQQTPFADFGMVYYDRGNAFYRSGSYAKAIADYNKAMESKSNNPDFYINRAMAYEGMRDYLDASRDYNQAISLRPDDVVALGDRCFDSAAADNALAKGLDDCSKALGLKPGDANLLDSRCFINFRLGQFDRAIADCTAALAADPQLSTSLYIRGRSELRLAELGRGDVAAERAQGTNDVAKAGAETRAAYENYVGMK